MRKKPDKLDPLVVEIIAKAVRRKNSLDPEVLCSCICDILESQFGEEMEDVLEETGLEKTSDIYAAIGTYVAEKFESPVTPNTSLTREISAIFKSAVAQASYISNDVVYQEAMKIVAEMYPGDQLEFQKTRLGLRQKERTMKLLDIYFYESDQAGSFRNVCSFLF